MDELINKDLLLKEEIKLANTLQSIADQLTKENTILQNLPKQARQEVSNFISDFIVKNTEQIKSKLESTYQNFSDEMAEQTKAELIRISYNFSQNITNEINKTLNTTFAEYKEHYISYYKTTNQEIKETYESNAK